MKNWFFLFLIGLLIASIWGYFADLKDGNILSFIIRALFIFIGGYIGVLLYKKIKK